MAKTKKKVIKKSSGDAAEQYVAVPSSKLIMERGLDRSVFGSDGRLAMKNPGDLHSRLSNAGLVDSDVVITRISYKPIHTSVRMKNLVDGDSPLPNSEFNDSSMDAGVGDSVSAESVEGELNLSGDEKSGGFFGKRSGRKSQK